jgi:hypothetical protein
MALPKDYKKYKWFVTSCGNMVVAGKSAQQNDALIGHAKEMEHDTVVMHTSSPGSPFSVILSEIKEVTKFDLEECATFTGCFSKAWKEGKRKTEVHVFRASQLEKKKGMKTGTWGVRGAVEKVVVELKLALTKQKNTYRAIPLSAVKKSGVLMTILPGKADKTVMADFILEKLKEKKAKKDELLSALPAGGITVL